MSRLAYVVGINNYLHWCKLKNPINDAKLIESTLKGVGFDTKLYQDLDYQDFSQCIYAFGNDLRNYNTGLFYYAGHGVEINGDNYLIPTNTEIESVLRVAATSINISKLIDQLACYDKSINIIILDTCRTHISFQRGNKLTGISYINAPKGCIVSYSTGPNSTASDGSGNNGLFTEVLCSYIPHEGIKIEDIFKNVRCKVEEISKGKQIPWEHSSLTGEFYFKEPKHEFNNKTITPQKIYDYAESVWDKYERNCDSDIAEALVFIDALNEFQISLIEVFRGYFLYQHELFNKGNLLSDAEIDLLAIERFKSLNFVERNQRWYYDGNPVRMGEILPLPPESEMMLPEDGNEIPVYIELSHSYRDNFMIISGKSNLPDYTELMIDVRNPKNNYFAQGKVKVINGEFQSDGFTNNGDKLQSDLFFIGITTPIYSVQDERAKIKLGNRCRNLIGDLIEFNPIGGNFLRMAKLIEL